ncbi:MAG: orotidine-5'-phosphate decarboxylase, partial [Blautia sp.]|nr:orotidine-5'-phosphate decarboxylase [Blautia sp.]
MIDELIEKIKKTKAPIVVGLDPTPALLPPYLLEEAGDSLQGLAEAFLTYNKGIVDAVCDIVPAVKPQIAMYEQLGIPGLMIFKETVDYCHDKGLIVIGDVKRGDIGSTSGAYSSAHLGTLTVGRRTFTPFGEDFATVNPYFGTDGIAPFLKDCKEHDKGIFVLVKTSNPSSGEFQDRLIDGRPLYEWVGEKVSEWGSDLIGMYGYSEVGA